MLDVVIIGSGPAGITAAIYAKRANLNVAVVEKEYLGTGQIAESSRVDNYPGIPGIDGYSLGEKFREHAESLGVEFTEAQVLSLGQKDGIWIIGCDEDITLESKAVIYATGCKNRPLGVPGEEKYYGRGLSFCAVCDGAMPIFRNRPLYVIGGGDSAVEEAVFLTKFGSKVYMVHRRDKLRASKIMQQRALNHLKIEILWDSEIVKIEGDKVVRHVIVKNLKTDKEVKHDAGGVFFAVGHTPNTAFMRNQIHLHDNGYIKVKPGTCQTNIDLVFAAGDAQDHVYRQAISAAGTGCMAAIEAERELSARGLIG